MCAKRQHMFQIGKPPIILFGHLPYYWDYSITLSHEFGINSKHDRSQSIRVRDFRPHSRDSQQELQQKEQDPLEDLINPGLVGLPAGSSSHVDEPDPREDGE